MYIILSEYFCFILFYSCIFSLFHRYIILLGKLKTIKEQCTRYKNWRYFFRNPTYTLTIYALLYIFLFHLFLSPVSFLRHFIAHPSLPQSLVPRRIVSLFFLFLRPDKSTILLLSLSSYRTRRALNKINRRRCSTVPRPLTRSSGRSENAHYRPRYNVSEGTIYE